MGKVGEGFKNFFTLEWLLDPGADDRERARQMEQNATSLWLNSQRYLPRERDLWSEEQVQNGGDSAVRTLTGNRDYQASQEAQMRALRQMQGIGEGGGYTALERDQIAQAQRQAAAGEKSQRDAQVQQMQMRGMAGGGGEMAARLQAQQGGANRAQGAATDIATAAQMRALQAMQAGAGIGAQVQNQATQRASAVDAFNQANIARRQGVEQRNAAARGGAAQQAFNNRMTTLAGATGQYNANSGNARDEANRQAAAVQGLIGGLLS